MGYGFWLELLGFVSGGVGLSVSVPQIVRVLEAGSHVGGVLFLGLCFCLVLVCGLGILGGLTV